MSHIKLYVLNYSAINTGLLTDCFLFLFAPQINYSLGLLLETRSEDIYRMKGLLSIHGSDFRYVYQVIDWETGAETVM